MNEAPTPSAMTEALRLGDELSARLAAAELRCRRQRQAIWRAIMLIRSGRTAMALTALQATLERKE